jgi:LysR family glycine cleavage system transcriptional activator
VTPWADRFSCRQGHDGHGAALLGSREVRFLQSVVHSTHQTNSFDRGALADHRTECLGRSTAAQAFQRGNGLCDTWAEGAAAPLDLTCSIAGVGKEEGKRRSCLGASTQDWRYGPSFCHTLAMKLPPLLSLRAFESVARHSNVRRAAEELRVDHSVVSRHLRTLQDSLGLKLVTATRRGVTLTPVGEKYAAAIGPALAEISAATHLAMQQAKPSSISICSIPGFALRWMTPRLSKFYDRYPTLEIALRPTDQWADFSNGEVDAEITFGDLPKRAATRSINLAHPRVFPVASPAWIAAHRAIQSADDLFKVPLIHEENHEQWRAWFIACGVAPPERLAGARLWHANLALEAARLGQGIALANDFLVEDEMARGELVEVIPSNVRLFHYRFTARSDRWNEEYLSHFRNWLIAMIRARPSTGVASEHLPSTLPAAHPRRRAPHDSAASMIPGPSRPR